MADEILSELVPGGNGIFTVQEAAARGIRTGSIQYLTAKGKAVRVSRGVYAVGDAWEDEFVSLQARFKKGIFSHETALFLWDLTDSTPIALDMTFPSTYNTTHAKDFGLRCTRTVPALYEVGITKITTPFGNKVSCYSMERTICDMLRPRHAADTYVLVEALRNYVRRKDRNIHLLSKTATTFRVAKRLRPYLEALL